MHTAIFIGRRSVTVSGPGQVNSQLTFNCNDPFYPQYQVEVQKNNTAYPQYGSVAPDFILTGSDGLVHSLSDELGKVVYLQFGASW